jgi:hypothetical protein
MKKLLLSLSLLLLGFGAEAQSVTRLIGASPFQDSLWVYDSTNFFVQRRMMLTPSSGGAITGINGIATDPTTGIIYVVVKQSAVTGRVLGTLNAYTGLVTIVGNLGDNFASITFNANGTLLGVTGDGAAVPETVYRIDKTNASKTLLRTLGNGLDGEIICFNPSDNMVYHWSGNGTIVFEKFDTSGVTVTNIPIIGTTNGETFGAVYRSNNTFITSNIGSRFQTWNANGTVGAQYGNSAPDDNRGLVLLTCNRAISGSSSFCAGDSTMLMATMGAGAYQWYKNGVAIAGATSDMYWPTTAGHYNVWISDACGADSTTAGIDITVNNLPSVSLSGTPSFCSGSSTLLTGTSGGTSQWYRDGSIIPGATANTHAANLPGVYNMTKTNINGCTDSASTGITVVENALPVVNISGNNEFCDGDSTLLTATSGGSHQWYMDGMMISGATGNTYYATASGNYNAIKTNANGCSDSASTGAAVIENPTPVVNLGADTTTCNMVVMLDAGNPGATYAWCDGSTAQTTIVTFSQVACVTVTDSNGCVGTGSVTVTIHSLPTVTASAMLDTACITDPPIALIGSPSGGTFTGPGTSGITFTPSTAGAGVHMIVYDYVDTTGCSNSDTITISVFTNPVATIASSSTTLCFDDASATLTGSPAGGTFGGPGVSGSSFNPATAGNGTHTVTYSYSDPSGCSDVATVQITVSACTGVNEQNGAVASALYPNPAGNNANIFLTEVSTITVCNAIGQVILVQQFEAGAQTLDVSVLAAGVYTVKIENAKGISVQRLLIQR